MYKPPRFTAVPWLETGSDLRAMGPPETTVEHGTAVTLGLYIPHPFGQDTDAFLMIRTADWRQGICSAVTLAVTNRLTFEPNTKPSDVTLLRNPIRHDVPDDDATERDD